MSNRRDLACDAVEKRISDIHVAAGLKTFRRNPDSQAKIEEMPICFLNEGEDRILKRSSRTASRKYGDVRNLEINIEVVGPKNPGVKSICRAVRSAVLDEAHPLRNPDGTLDTTTFLAESHTIGPVGYGVPGIEVMLLVINLIYVDEP